LHLDAPFQGVTADDERVGAALAQATYQAFTRVVDVCLEHEVDFLLIAGDAYNSADKSLRAQLVFRREMQRLAGAGIAAFIAHGNHDPVSGWSAGLALPQSVRVFSAGRVERLEFCRAGEVVAAVYGRSFGKAAETAGFAEGYRRDPADPIAIGVLHANVGGDPEYDPYAPATLEELRAGHMDYWALGHIHKHEVLARDPWIVYAGSPQGLNPKETGVHGCMLVEVGRSGVVSAQHIETAPVVWAAEQIDLSDAADLQSVQNLLTDACARLREQADERAVVTRIALVGRTAAHADLVRPGVLDALLAELRSEQSSATPWVWVDRLDVRTAGAIDLDEVRSGPDFAAELLRITDELAEDPDAVQQLLGQITAPLATTLGGYESSADPILVLEQARDIALDQLLGGGDGR
jgi:DNA repair exonuclease SbcCD nuclease subunit